MEYLTVKEFREMGLLQEVNRRLLHPLGFALSVKINEDGSEELAEIWKTDDPEGWAYGEDILNKPDFSEKAAAVEKKLQEKLKYRKENLGFDIQPVKED